MPKGTKILMVDDDKMLIDLYKERLELAGYTVEVSRDGEEGLAKIHTVKPDLVLLDIMMPKVNGYEALASIKSDPATKDVPVIILSALMRDVNKSKAVESGADDYIIKSEAMPADVIQKIEAVMKKYHKETPAAAPTAPAEPPPATPEPPVVNPGPPASPNRGEPPASSPPSPEIQFEPSSPSIGGTDLAPKPPAPAEPTPPPAEAVPQVSPPTAVPPVVPHISPAQPAVVPQKTSPIVVFLLVIIFILLLSSIATNILLYLRFIAIQ